MTLTEEQVKYWRSVLYHTLQDYAWIMPVWQIEQITENLQRSIDMDANVYQRKAAAREAREIKEKAAREGKEKAREDSLASLATRVTDALE